MCWGVLGWRVRFPTHEIPLLEVTFLGFECYIREKSLQGSTFWLPFSWDRGPEGRRDNQGGDEQMKEKVDLMSYILTYHGLFTIGLSLLDHPRRLSVIWLDFCVVASLHLRGSKMVMYRQGHEDAVGVLFMWRCKVLVLSWAGLFSFWGDVFPTCMILKCSLPFFFLYKKWNGSNNN